VVKVGILKLMLGRRIGDSILPDRKLERKVKLVCTFLSANENNFRV